MGIMEDHCFAVVNTAKSEWPGQVWEAWLLRREMGLQSG